VSDEQVAGQLDRRLQRLKERAGGEDALERIYGKSIVELREDYEADFREQLLAEQLRRRRMQDIKVTPSEVQAWFEEIPQDSLPRLPKTVRLSHIVRYPSPDESARKRAREVITSIRDSIVTGGASFEEMARQFSDDSGTASSGGRLADVSLDDLVPEFAAVATRTPVGNVSQVFYNEAQSGYHILRVNSRQGTTVDLNHILIRVDQSNADASRAKEFLSAVRDTLMEYDVPFELMAKRHSQEERSAQNGGRVTDPQSGVRDLRLEALGPSWRRVIQRLDEGDISEPAEVRLLDGDRAYHIVLLEGLTPAHRVNLEQDYSRIRQFALQDKQQRVMQEWINGLREEVYVDIRIQKDDVPTELRLSARR
jgi:peptidyl-prolyl cis-trans isomerase SurA